MPAVCKAKAARTPMKTRSVAANWNYLLLENSMQMNLKWRFDARTACHTVLGKKETRKMTDSAEFAAKRPLHEVSRHSYYFCGGLPYSIKAKSDTKDFVKICVRFETEVVLRVCFFRELPPKNCMSS